MPNRVDFLAESPATVPGSSEIKVARQRTQLNLALHGWIQGSLSKRHKHLQSMSSHTTSPSPHLQNLKSAFESCEGNILIRLNSTSVNEDWSTSMVDTSISEVEKDCPCHALVLSIRLDKIHFKG